MKRKEALKLQSSVTMYRKENYRGDGRPMDKGQDPIYEWGYYQYQAWDKPVGWEQNPF